MNNSNKSSKFIVYNHKIYRSLIAMFTEGKIIEIFCLTDDFCKFFDALLDRYSIKEEGSAPKRRYCRASRMSKAEIMLILIIFHASRYRCLKHYYLQYVCTHLRHLFSHPVSYNRFVELEREMALPIAILIKKVLLGKCTGIIFVDSTPLRVCRNPHIPMHRPD